jgi:hypothetical protein
MLRTTGAAPTMGPLFSCETNTTRILDVEYHLLLSAHEHSGGGLGS